MLILIIVSAALIVGGGIVFALNVSSSKNKSRYLY